MVDSQLDLFGEEKQSFLHVVQDGEHVFMGMDELFDSNVFHRLRAVSFVASAKFFFDTVNEFKEVELILGIADGDFAESFEANLFQMIDINNRVEILRSLSADTREKMVEDTFRLRYSRTANPIHTKLYLLEGDYVNRVIIGSANFTQMAFGNHKQYEDVLVFDNHSLFEVYEKRYHSIYEQTSDFIPEKIKGKQQLILDPDFLVDVMLDEMKGEKIHFSISEEEMDALKDRQLKKKTQIEDDMSMHEVIKVITKKDKQTKNYEIIPQSQLEKKRKKLTTVHSRTDPNTEKLDRRNQLEYEYMHQQLAYRQDNGEFIFYSEPLKDSVKIRESLLLIEQFIKAYEKYTVREHPNILSKVYEVVLYSFMGPFMWKLREEAVKETGRDAVRRNYPPFLIIGETSGSGKTTLLEFIEQLVDQRKYFSYKELSRGSVLSDLFHSSNVTPLLVDEIQPNFFTSTAQNKGEILIKDVSNTIENQHPVLIGTTNASSFALPAQALSRIYYLSIDNSFDEQFADEAARYLDEVLTGITADLYRDFLYRVERMIAENKIEMKRDFLYIAREIFKDYYTEAEIKMPEWFPQGIFDDYLEKGQQTWRHLYETYPDAFVERDKEALIVKLELMREAYGQTRSTERLTVINLLPAKVIIDQSHVLVLHRQYFYEFIHMKEGRELSWLKRLFMR